MNKNREEIVSTIIKSFYFIYNSLGYGFLEKVYENALAFELREHGLFVQQQEPIAVYFKNVKVGDYFADLLVENQLIVEMKAAEFLKIEHEAQLLNYLKATNIELGLLLNCGPKPEVRRKIYQTARHK